jgi:nucleoside-diphosphate-sugar epimerase
MSKTINNNILLFGATGKMGEQICKELMSRGMRLSVFVREESANKLTGNGMKIIYGNVLNLSDVEAAINGDNYTDVIISLGSKMLKGTEIRSLGTQHIMKALQSSQAKSKVHVISALGVGDSWDQLGGFGKLISNLLLKSVLEDHRKQEEIVMNNSNPYHILRPVGLKDGDPTGAVHLQLEGRLPSTSVMRSDVAKFLVDSMFENREGISAICQKK